ncbi:MAG: AI-2E family transporter [Oscillospiraceae bacterium]|nr:AI-2E family transporter [Oscillospiraceae bacterium]
MKERKDRTFLKIFILAAAIILFTKLVFDFGSFTGMFGFIMGIVRPFFLGFIVAFCINIPVSWLEKKIKIFSMNRAFIKPTKSASTNQKSKKPKSKTTVTVDGSVVTPEPKKPKLYRSARVLSMVINLILLAGFIVFGLSSIIPMLYENVRQLVEEIPGYIDTAVKAMGDAPFFEELGLNEVLANMSLEDVWVILPEFDVAQMISSLFSGVFVAFLTIVATLYFLADYNSVKSFVKRTIRAHSPKHQRPILKYIRLIDFSFRKFISCQFLDCLILATITMVAFTIMGSEYAVTLALMLGVMNVIPYFGSIIGTAIAVFIIWATSGINTAIVVAITLVIIQQIEGNFINPKIMGTSFKISPVLVIIAITIGGAIGGILGMIFAIPVANVLKTILEEYLQNKEKLRVRLGEIGEPPSAQTTQSGETSEI